MVDSQQRTSTLLGCSCCWRTKIDGSQALSGHERSFRSIFVQNVSLAQVGLMTIY